MRGLIINHDSKYTGELSKLFNKCDVVCYTHFNLDHANQYDYIVLSGGEINISHEPDITLEKFFLKTCNKPIFAVCLGMQILSIIAGETLNELDARRRSPEELSIFDMVGDMTYNHGWYIGNIPNGYEGVMGSDGVLRAIYNDKVMAFQGHPELSGEFGLKLRDRFYELINTKNVTENI